MKPKSANNIILLQYTNKNIIIIIINVALNYLNTKNNASMLVVVIIEEEMTLQLNVSEMSIGNASKNRKNLRKCYLKNNAGSLNHRSVDGDHGGMAVASISTNMEIQIK